MVPVSKNYTEEFELSENTYQRRGYTFIGWDVNVEGKNVFYKPREKLSKLDRDAETINLYTVWKENIYLFYYYDK